jgi:hypothetical protein
MGSLAMTKFISIMSIDTILHLSILRAHFPIKKCHLALKLLGPLSIRPCHMPFTKSDLATQYYQRMDHVTHPRVIFYRLLLL